MSASTADGLLQKLGLRQLAGENAPAPASSLDLPNFDWASRPQPGEAASTPAFLEFLSLGLQNCGVVFGRDGYKIMDTHTETTSLEVVFGGLQLRGGVDAMIVPARLAKLCASSYLRVAVVLKGDAAALEAHLPQALVQLIATAWSSSHPPALLLTNGSRAIFLRFTSGGVEKVACATMGHAVARVAAYLLHECLPSDSACGEEEVDAKFGGAAPLVKKLKRDAPDVVIEELEAYISELTYVKPAERRDGKREYVLSWLQSAAEAAAEGEGNGQALPDEEPLRRSPAAEPVPSHAADALHAG